MIIEMHIVILFFIRIRGKIGLETFAVEIVLAGSLFIKLYVSFWIWSSSLKIILLFICSLHLIEVIFGKVPRHFYLGCIEERNRWSLASIKDWIVPSDLCLSHRGTTLHFVMSLCETTCPHSLYFVFHYLFYRRCAGFHLRLFMITEHRITLAYLIFN